MNGLRSAILLLSILFSVSTYAQDETVDVSGRKGDDGRHGVDRNGRASRNRVGQDGGDATEPEAGTDGSHIMGELKYDVSGNPVVTGMILPPGGRDRNFTRVLLDTQLGKFRLVSNGGDGGHGGDGGDGEDGGKGNDGADATRYSSGGNGDTGRRGGDSGDPTSGEDAGRAGDIGTDVSEADLELLVFIETMNIGGDGGRAGDHGRPGSGGPGGDGGDPYSWTTSETVTDGEGNRSTEYTHHRNSGGWDGSTGPSGSRSRKVVHDGRDGADGRSWFKVKRANGEEERVFKRFLLGITNYDIISENEDGIVEPGEEIKIRNFTITNHGETETPHGAEIAAYLGAGDYVIGHEEFDAPKIKVPKKLMPGESYTFPEDIFFRVRDGLMKSAGAKRFQVTGSLLPIASLEKFQRSLPEIERAIPVEITYPVEITPVNFVDSLAAGQATRISLKIKNLSDKKGFGSESELKRAVKVHLESIGGNIEESSLKIVSADGQIVKSLEEGLITEFRNLEPGASKFIEAELAVGMNAVPYTSSVLASQLFLGKKDRSGSLLEVQEELLEFNISAEFELGGPDTDLILVVNKDLSHDAYMEWKKVADERGKTLKVWDLSYYGYMDVLKDLGDGFETSTLAEEIRGKSMVILDNTFTTGRDTEVNALEHLSKIDYQHLAARYGVGVYVLRDQNSDTSRLGEYAMPTDVQVEEYSTRDDFENKADLTGDSGEDVYTMKAFEYAYSRGSFFAPSERTIRRYTEQQYSRLQKAYPDQNFVLAHEFTGTKVRYRSFLGMSGWLFGKRWDVGKVHIRRLVDSKTPRGLEASMNEHQIMSANFVGSSENHLALSLIESDVELIKSLERLSKVKNPSESQIKILKSTAEAVQHSLALEQLKARQLSQNSKSDYEKLKTDLPLLELFSEADINLDRNSAEVVKKQIIDLIAQIAFFADHSVNKPFPSSTSQRINSITNDKLKKTISRFYGVKSFSFWSVFKGDKGNSERYSELEVRKLIRGKYKTLLVNYAKEFYGVENAIFRGLFSLFDMSRSRRLEEKIPKAFRDNALGNTNKGGVISKAELDRIDAKAKAHENRRTEVQKAHHEVQENLIENRPLTDLMNSVSAVPPTPPVPGGSMSCSGFL